MPVAPDFQNPPTAPNHIPYFSNTEPAHLRTVTAGPTDIGPGYRFVALVGDQNLGDKLYVRWVSDYPPFAANITKVLRDALDGFGLPLPPSMPQAELRPEIPFDVQCAALATGMQQHRIAIIVSDRPFLKVDGTFDGDLRYNRVQTRDDGSPVTYPIMAGWNLVCPL